MAIAERRRAEPRIQFEPVPSEADRKLDRIATLVQTTLLIVICMGSLMTVWFLCEIAKTLR